MSISHIRKAGSLSFIALITVLVLGWILRAQVTLVPDLIPGVNGAYYLVQTRAILHTGFLGIPDFPLLFYFQAFLSAVISLFTSTDLAVFTAVRLIDTILPVLLAVPVCLFARQFALNDNQRYISAAASLTIGLIAVGNESIKRMAGDFQKNAVALPLFLAFVYFLYMSLEYHHRRDIILSLIFLCLICFTHIGVAALAITTTGLIIIISTILNKDLKRALIIVSVLVISLFISLYLVSLFDLERVIRLVRFVINPGKLFSGSLVSTWLGLSFRPNTPFVLEGVVIGNAFGVLGILTAVVYRKNMDYAVSAVLWASSLNALLYASPFIGGELSQRLGMMAFVPALIPLTFFVTRNKWNCIVSVILAFFILFSPN